MGRRYFSEDAGYGAASLIFLICALVLAFPWISGAVTIPWDAKAHFQPQFVFLAHAFHSGQSPFWTPNVFAGSPQIADPQSLIFSPFFLLAALLSAAPSFRLEDSLVFAMLVMGGLAIIAFFRARAWHSSGALVAALAFAFGGSAAWRIQHTGQIMSLSWFPAALWLLARALDRRSMVWGAGAGIVAAFLVLGRDQVAFLEVLLLTAYALFRILSDDKAIVTALAPLFAGLVCGLAIIAIPLALTLELASQSNRPAIDLAGALRGSLHPASFLTLISANLYGTDGPLKDFWGPPSAAFGTRDIFLARNMGDAYMGALPALALLSAFRRGFWADKEIRFFTLAALALLFYALGRFTPVFAWMFQFPGVDLFRRPADATFPLCAILAILAGYSVHLVATEPQKFSWRILAAAAGAAFGAAILVAIDKHRLAHAALPLAQSMGFAALAFVILVFVGRLAQMRGFILPLVIGAAMTLDLAVSNKPNESTGLPPEKFDVLREESRNETIALLRSALAASAAADRRDRIELAAIDFHWPNASLVHGLDHDLGYNPIRLKLFEDATGAGDHVALPEQRVFSSLFPSYRSTMADLLGLRFIATGVPIEEIDKNVKPGDVVFLARTNDAYVYENKRALPRVLLATCAVRVDFAKMIQNGVWPDVDYRSTVLLEEPSSCHGSSEAKSAGQARVLSYGNADIRVEAIAPEGGGYLVLNDVWQSWWVAEVDGRPAPLLRANVMFRAVAVPAGRHEVRFLFQPLQGLWKRFVGG